MKAFVLSSGEEEVAKFRQSPAVLAFPIVRLVALTSLPGLYIWHFQLWSLAGTVYTIWLLVHGGIFLHSVLLWYLDVYRVTTTRFIKSTYRTIFHQHVSETTLDRILNISFKTTGPWSVLMGFGDVELQVVGRMEPIVVKHVKNPGTLKEYLLRLHEQMGRSTGAVDPVSMSKEGLLPGNK